MRLLLAVASCFIITSLAARGDTLINAIGSTATAVNPYDGESFVLDGRTPFNNIGFSFFTSSGTYALGNGYLFTRGLGGTPADLPAASAFLVGTATASGSAYVFDPTLVLFPGQLYVFYEDAYITPNTLLGGGNAYPETRGLAFSAPSASTSYTAAAPLDFQVTGTAVTAEPSSLLLLATGLSGIAALMCTRCRERIIKWM